MSVVDFEAALVTKPFLDGADWSLTASDSGLSTTASIRFMQDFVPFLQRLEVRDCLQTYGAQYVSEYNDFLAVAESANRTNSVLAYGFDRTSLTPTTDMCIFSSPHSGEAISGDTRCTYGENSTIWELKFDSGYGDPRGVGPNYVLDSDFPYRGVWISVDYCMAQKAPEQCKIFLSIPFLVVVIICNCSKLICLAILLSQTHQHPLITFGDGIAEFLQSPDKLTSNVPSLSYWYVEKYLSNDCHNIDKISNRRDVRFLHDWQVRQEPLTQKRWFVSASMSRWWFTLLW